MQKTFVEKLSRADRQTANTKKPAAHVYGTKALAKGSVGEPREIACFGQQAQENYALMDDTLCKNRFGSAAWWLSQSPNGRFIINGTMAKLLTGYEQFQLTLLALNNRRLKEWHSAMHCHQSQCEFCGEVEEALLSLYKLTCCEMDFPPDSTVRLYPSIRAARKGYKYQDLMIGRCPECNAVALACVSVDADGDPIGYEVIPRQQHSLWRRHCDVRSIYEGRPKLDKTKHSLKQVDTVSGSIYNQKIGKYIYSDTIRVR